MPDEVANEAAESTDLGVALSEAYDEQVARESKEAESRTPSAPAASSAPSEAPAPRTRAPASSAPAPEASAPAVSAPAPRPIPERLKAKWAEKWETLDPALREEFHGYESNIGSLASRYGQAAKHWEGVQKIFAPYEAAIKAEGGDVFSAMGSLLETSRILRSGTPEQKIAMVKAMATSFKIPLEQVVGMAATAAPSAGTPSPSSAAPAGVSDELLNRFTAIERRLLTRDAEEQHNVATRVASEVQSFVQDPANTHIKEHGEEFLDIMTSLIQSGQAQDIKAAYEKAAWLHPAARQQEIVKVSAQRVQARAADAAKAKAAAVSQNGNAPGAVTRDPSKMNLRETLSAAFDGDLSE